MLEITDWNQLPSPALLKQSIWIHVYYGNEKTWWLCSRCDLQEVQCTGPDGGKFSVPTQCLIFAGDIVKDRNNIPSTLKVTLVVLPAVYVTYIGLGPPIEAGPTAKGGQDRIIVNPSSPDAPGKMNLEAIRATLAELSEPVQH